MNNIKVFSIIALLINFIFISSGSGNNEIIVASTNNSSIVLLRHLQKRLFINILVKRLKLYRIRYKEIYRSAQYFSGFLSGSLSCK